MPARTPPTAGPQKAHPEQALPEQAHPEGDPAHVAAVPRAEIVGISELLVRLILASRAVERARPRRGPDLSPHAVRATMHLFQHGRVTVGELADGLAVSMGWASRIADELERSGHVLRERDPGDRRVVRLRLSPVAEQVAERMYRERGRAVAEALATLPAADRPVVARFLGRLIEGLEELAGAPPPESGP